jgi:hypothetical protein
MLARTQADNQLQAVVDTAPTDVRERLRHLRLSELIAHASRFRVGTVVAPIEATRLALRTLSQRSLALDAEINMLDAQIAQLVLEVAPQLCAVWGVGPDTAAALLVADGDNPERLVVRPGSSGPGSGGGWQRG